MIAEIEVQQNGTTPETAYHEGLKDAHDRALTWERREDQAQRDHPDVRAQMCKLVPELGGLIRAHARQLGVATGEDCPFQLDAWGDILCWQLMEFLTNSEMDKEFREDNVRAFQLTKAHAAYHFDWPPAPESEV